MLLSGDTLKQELIDVQSGVNPAGAMPTMQGDYQFYNNLYLFTVIPNSLGQIGHDSTVVIQALYVRPHAQSHV